MAVSTDSKTLASDFNSLLTTITAEKNKRKYYGNISGMSVPSSKSAGDSMTAADMNKMAEIAYRIKSWSSTKLATQNATGFWANWYNVINTGASYTSQNCSTACTGYCTSTCANGCTGCANTCSGACVATCSDACSTGCGSGCGYACTGCGSCSTSCSSECSSCTGCSSRCYNTCKGCNGCSGCYSGCSAKCSNACSGCNTTCTHACATSCNSLCVAAASGL